MGRRRIAYYQVYCDYMEHTSDEDGRYELSKGTAYRVFNGGDLVICEDCWNNKLVVEKLLKILNIGMLATQVGQEK